MTTDTTTVLTNYCVLRAPTVSITSTDRVKISLDENASMYLSIDSARSLHQQLTGVLGVLLQTEVQG